MTLQPHCTPAPSPAELHPAWCPHDLPDHWRDRTKAAFSTRRVDLGRARRMLTGDVCPRPGDLVLARVDRIRQHTRIELCNGRKANLYDRDTVLLAYGNRYATDQFEARVPDHIGPCHMVAAGGLASWMVSRSGCVKPATEITPLGLLLDDQERVMNLAHWALPTPLPAATLPAVICVLGSAMNAGKTTTAASLINGLCQAGKRVAAAKVTGTGSGGDLWKMADAGAADPLDFTDAGHISTDRLAVEEVLSILHLLVGHLAARRPDAIILEIADGLFQPQTSALITSPAFRAQIDGVLFTSGDIVGAIAGSNILLNNGYRVIGTGGRFTQSELAVREVTDACALPVFTRQQLQDPQVARHFVDRLAPQPEPESAP